MKKNEIFKFKKFNVQHSLNAQKISTDSVLLGAWANIHKANNILDIGTGTGVLSLMCAQRNVKAKIVAIEIEKTFAEEARMNFSNTPFADRIELIETDIKKYIGGKFDHIICNPPYFSNSLKSNDSLRNLARHDLNLDLDSLGAVCFQLLNMDGIISLVIPTEIYSSLILKFEKIGLYLNRICSLKHTPDLLSSLELLEFGKISQLKLVKSELIVKIENRYSEEYQNLLKEFLIIF